MFAGCFFWGVHGNRPGISRWHTGYEVFGRFWDETLQRLRQFSGSRFSSKFLKNDPPVFLGMAKLDISDLSFSQGDESDALPSISSMPFLALEAGEIENRLRKHTIELTEPAIARTAAFERKLHEMRLYTDHNAENLKQLHHKLSGQENLKLTVESFRGELFEWDKERRDHQHLMNEKLCLQEDELSALHRKIELQSFRTEACDLDLGDFLLFFYPWDSLPSKTQPPFEFIFYF